MPEKRRQGLAIWNICLGLALAVLVFTSDRYGYYQHLRGFHVWKVAVYVLSLYRIVVGVRSLLRPGW